MHTDIDYYVNAFLLDLEIAGNSYKTVDTYRFALERYARFCTANHLDFREASPRRARHFRNFLAASSFKPASINLCLSAVRSLYDFLVFEGLVQSNPVNTGRLKVKKPDRLPGFLTPAEKERVLAWMAGKPRHVELAFHTMFATGIRVRECVQLAPGDVLVIEQAYLLHVRDAKGTRERLAPVVDRRTAFDLVDFAQRRTGAERLFGVALYTLEWHARNCRLDTGVAFHTLRCRHTFATELLQQGVPIDVIQEALGHRRLDTTRIYARTAPEAVTRLATHV
ncbi:MAG: tyrosine-type recombinase/integrase [Candidatus Desulforudis sp.]|nr:tyrosine-type recombinase/integrase [Desulforudis sp.]